MRKVITVLVVCGSFAAVAPGALANDPHEGTTGPPSQSCQELNPTPGQPNSNTPGHAQESPGSPFDEPGEGSSPEGGKGGLHYSEKSQYDVACYQHSVH
jgi:hypothetical protein